MVSLSLQGKEEKLLESESVTCNKIIEKQPRKEAWRKLIRVKTKTTVKWTSEKSLNRGKKEREENKLSKLGLCGGQLDGGQAATLREGASEKV